MDNVYLTSPAGSMIAIGSWMRADPAPDYGAHDLFTQIYNQNPLVDGGRFSYESAGLRKMSFPLIVPSGGVSGQSLDLIEALLRLYVRPNGYIDIQPDGVPTAEMVRFDLLGGRVNHDPYSVQLQRIDRRFLRLELDTQPFGYWPTWIALASLASIAPPVGAISLSSASVIGDVPGFVQMLLAPSAGPSVFGGGNILGGALNPRPDFLAWSLAARPSFVALRGADTASAARFTPSTNAIVPGGVIYPLKLVASGATAFSNETTFFIATAIEPAYRGRFRAFLYARSLATSAAFSVPVLLSADAIRWSGQTVQDGRFPALASAQPVATLAPQMSPSIVAGIGTYGASSVFSLLDLGELTLPGGGSGVAQLSAIRIWTGFANTGSLTATVALATQAIDIGALYLLPLDGPNAIIPRGVALPSIGRVVGNYNPQLFVDSNSRDAAFDTPSSTLLNREIQISAFPAHRGGFPYLGASSVQLDLLIADQLVGNPTLVASNMAPHRGTAHTAAVSVQYRPRFAFLKGL